MKHKNKWFYSVLLFSAVIVGYGAPEVTTEWSDSLPGENQSIESVQDEMDVSEDKTQGSNQADKVFKQEQNRVTTLPTNPELSDSDLDYLTFCNEQLPDMLKSKFDATLLSSSDVTASTKNGLIILNYHVEGLKTNSYENYGINCTIKNGKAKLFISEDK